MKSIISLFILIFISLHSLAQPEAPEKKNIVKFTPLKIFAFENASLEFSYERVTSDYLSTQIMLSWLLPERIMIENIDYKRNIRGYRIAIEERIYFTGTGPKGHYIAFELDHFYKKFNEQGDFYREIEEDGYYYDDLYTTLYGVEKRIFNISAKYGYQFLTEHFSFDLYGGLGVRFREVRHFNKPGGERYYENPLAWNLKNTEGKGMTIHIPLNFRIGYRF